MMRKFGYKLAVLSLMTLSVGCSQTASLGTLTGREKQDPAPLKKGSKQDSSMEFELARGLEKQGKLLKAQEMYLHLWEETPQNPQILHRLGVVSARLNQHDQAAHYFLQALQIDKHNSAALADLGYSLYLKGDLPAAETALRQAMREDANNDRAINNLAMVVGQQGRTQEAYALFRSVVDEAEANSNLAYVMSQSGNHELAAKRYSMALSIDEDLEKASMALLQIAEHQTRAKQMAALEESERKMQTAQQAETFERDQVATKLRPVSTRDDDWYKTQNAGFELPSVVESIN